MTDQRDPVQPRNVSIRGDERSFGVMPILLGLALLLGLGYFAMNAMTTDRDPSVQRSDAPVTSTTPRTTPTAPK